jgi:diguanylate cyclase (GGDEF)-like protein
MDGHWSIAPEPPAGPATGLLAEVIGAISEGVAILDPEGRVAIANPAAAQLLGREPEALPRMRVDELLAGIDIGSGVVERAAARLTRPDGTEADVEIRIVAIGSDGARVVCIRDPSGRAEVEERLLEIGERDPLTGLLNRRRFEVDVEKELARSGRYGGGALLALGVDGFTAINRRVGYRSGDELLREIATIVKERIRETDIAARLGGDEFAIVLTEVSVECARAVGDDLVQLIGSHPFEIDGKLLRLRVSAGVIGLTDGPADAADALGWAELAMRRAKAMGGGRTVAFQESLLPGDRPAQTWSERIRDALDDGTFVPYFQPILELASDSVTSWEVLIRMRGEGDEVIPPESFVPTAERFGLIQELDRWVVGSAIEAMEAHADRPELSLEVNLSGKSIGDPDMLTAIRAQIEASPVDPSRLIFEVTETAAIANLEQASRFGRELLDLGCGFALDDFGTGFASFYYLKRLPLTHLKIDGDFIRGLSASPVDQLVVKAIVEIARGMGLRTIAEYVEDAPTLELLREFGVDYCQGFEVGPPTAPEPPDLIPPPYDGPGPGT